MCGKEFYTKTPKKVKYCPQCLIKSRRKEFINVISNDDFKGLYKRFLPYIKKCAEKYLSYNSEMFDSVVEQSIVNIWIRWVAMINNGMAVNELSEITKTELFYCVKYSYYAVIRARDLPPTLHCHNKKIAEEELNVLRLDMPRYSDMDKPDNLIEYIVDSKPLTERLFDLKKLVNQIMIESVLDSDVKAAIVRAELDDINVGKTITEDDKVKLINDEYGLPIQNTKQLRVKAQNGIYKLYNAYSPEIKDVLEMSDNDFRLVATGKEVQRHRFTTSVKRCPICGKAFISNYLNGVVCGDKKCKAEYANQKKREHRAKDKIRELLYKAGTTDSQKERSEILTQVSILL